MKPLPEILWMPCALNVVLRHTRVPRALGGLPRSAYGNASLLPFSLSFTYAAIDEHTMTYVFGKLDFAYLHETFSRYSEIADRKWSTRQGEFRIPLSSYHPRDEYSRMMSLSQSQRLPCHTTAGETSPIPSTLPRSRCPLIIIPSPLVISTLSST